jgi:signal transduction histidine kinase
MQNRTYSEKSEIVSSLLTKNEVQYPLQVFSDFFTKYSLTTIEKNIKKDTGKSIQVDLKRLLEAGHIMTTTQVGPPISGLVFGNNSHANFLAVLADVIDAKLKIAETSMNKIIEEHEFRLFAIRPDVACHISTFRMIIANCRNVLQDSINNVKFQQNDFSLHANVTSFNLAMFVDEITSPFRLYEDAIGKILEITNNIAYDQLILSDKIMLEIILSSVLHIAFNHSVRSNMVSLRVHSMGEQLYMSIKSIGKQISDSNIKKLFGPFINTSHLGSTGGVNLYLAKICIEKLGGAIYILSETTETVIEVKLPCLLK